MRLCHTMSLLDRDYPGKFQAVNRIIRFESFQSITSYFAGHLPSLEEGEGPSIPFPFPFPPGSDRDRASSLASVVTAHTHLSGDDDPDVIAPRVSREVPPRDTFAEIRPSRTPRPSGSRRSSAVRSASSYPSTDPGPQAENTRPRTHPRSRPGSRVSSSGRIERSSHRQQQQEEALGLRRSSRIKQRDEETFVSRGDAAVRGRGGRDRERQGRRRAGSRAKPHPVEPSVTATPGQNRRRTATNTRQSPAGAILGGKGNRDQEAVQAGQEREEPGATKRRASADNTKESQASTSSRRQTTQGESAASRVTRAQRQLLPEEDGQLFRLGRHGEFEVQVAADDVQEDVSNDATGRSRRPSTRTGTRAKPDRGRVVKRSRRNKGKP